MNLGLALVRRLARKEASGGNHLGLVIGPTRSGKSWSTLALAEQLDSEFSAWNVCFTPEEFLTKLNDPRLKRGSVLVFDEAGVGIPSKEWYSISNKCISQVAQTFGHMGLIVFFTVPSWGFIDSDMRKMFHSVVEMIYPARKDWIDREVRRGRWFDISADTKREKLYFKYPVFTDELGDKKRLTFLEFSRPSDELVAAYEARSTPYKEKVRVDSQQKVAGLRVKGGADVEVIVDQVLANQPRYVRIAKTGRRSIDVGLLEQDFKIGGRVASRVKSVLRERLDTHTASKLVKNKRLKVRRAARAQERDYIG